MASRRIKLSRTKGGDPSELKKLLDLLPEKLQDQFLEFLEGEVKNTYTAGMLLEMSENDADDVLAEIIETAIASADIPSGVEINVRITERGLGHKIARMMHLSFAGTLYHTPQDVRNWFETSVSNTCAQYGVTLEKVMWENTRYAARVVWSYNGEKTATDMFLDQVVHSGDGLTGKMLAEGLTFAQLLESVTNPLPRREIEDDEILYS